MDLFGDDGTLYYQVFGLGDPVGLIPTDLPLDHSYGKDWHQFGAANTDAAREFDEWARLDPDVYTLSHGHANGRPANPGGSDETVTTTSDPIPTPAPIGNDRRNGQASG